MISFKNVTKVYKSKNKTTLALDNISFELPNKGLQGLSGKNGEFYETKKYSTKKELCVIYRENKGVDSFSPTIKMIVYEGYDSEIREGYKCDKGIWQ